ncbi:MAG: phage holin family protein [Patescibacteria group bacterium]
MKFIGGFIFHIFSNAVALLAAAYFVSGFKLDGNFLKLLIVAVVLTLINAFIRPILKLLLGPLILLTFGLFIIVINAISLYILDLWSQSLTIQGLPALLWSTLIISATNIIITVGAKNFYKKE